MKNGQWGTHWMYSWHFVTKPDEDACSSVCEIRVSLIVTIIRTRILARAWKPSLFLVANYKSGNNQRLIAHRNEYWPGLPPISATWFLQQFQNKETELVRWHSWLIIVVMRLSSHWLSEATLPHAEREYSCGQPNTTKTKTDFFSRPQILDNPKNHQNRLFRVY